MKKSKVSDEQIIEKLQDPEYTSDRQIAVALGVTPNGSFNKRLRELRKNNGMTEPSRRRGRSVSIESQDNTILKFQDIRKEDRLLKDGKRLIVISIGEQGMSCKRMDGSTTFIHRKDFEKKASEYTKVPPGDPQGSPVKNYHIDPEPKLSAGDIQVNGQPIKNLPESVKEKIMDKLKEKIAPEAAIQEMEEKHKKPADNSFPLEPKDYIDPEWGVVLKPETAVKPIRDYLADINQLLDILIGDCTDLEMAEQVKKIVCFKLVIGFRKEVRESQGVGL